jgi:hypothetical protein
MITVTVVGDRELIERFRALPGVLVQRLQPVMTRLMLGLQRTVKEAKLSGQVLKNRTGHLRASIAETVTASGDTVTGRVGIFSGPTVVYGRAHEYGFTGTVSVPAHTRTVSNAFGHAIAPVSVSVRAHTRRLHLPERSFLRSALTEQRPAILDGLRAGIAEAVHA